MSGLPDLPENYGNATYALDERDGETTLIVTTDNIDAEESADHTEEKWKSVHESLRNCSKTTTILDVAAITSSF